MQEFHSYRKRRMVRLTLRAWLFSLPAKCQKCVKRRDGLLRRLLQPDVERYYSAILQCVRYIVSTDFLRLERPHIEGQPEVQPQPSPVQQAATEQPGDEPDNQLMDTEPTDLDDEEIAGLGSLLRKE
eukprot:g997.t1